MLTYILTTRYGVKNSLQSVKYSCFLSGILDTLSGILDTLLFQSRKLASNSVLLFSAVTTLFPLQMSAESKPEPIMAYCVKCNEKREMVDAVEIETKTKVALKAKCGECEGGLFRFVGSKSKNRPEGYYVKRAKERRLEARKKKLLDGVPTIRAAYWSDEGSESKSEEGSK